MNHRVPVTEETKTRVAVAFVERFRETPVESAPRFE